MRDDFPEPPAAANPVRVVIVDDSRSMRALLRVTLERDPGIRVVGEAADPFEAREAIRALSPDVVTLDVNMPRMDGLEFLEKLMRLRPTPVIMVSSEVASGAAASIEALSMGAVDCVCKPTLGQPMPFADLPAKVRVAAGTRVGAPRGHSGSVPAAPFAPNGRVLAIGASTGGVEALLQVLSGFPVNCPPTVIVQHMPASFTGSFARRLDGLCAAQVREARAGERLRPGAILLAPGGPCHLEVSGRQTPFVRLVEGPERAGHRPSVDALFSSLARLGPRAVGVILTGMGRDGAEGLLSMRAAGAPTLGQDAATSLVYGMPRAAQELGAVERQLPIEAIGAAALALCARAGAGGP